MINTIIDEHRKNTSYNKIIQLNGFENDYDYGDEGIDWNEAEERLDAEPLLKLIHDLPASECKVFNLYAVDGYQHSEIEALMEMV